ncbi:lymphotoxin-beta-like isoform X2 [Dromiciops gliroides]|uniref:lymphotoxin-beta-like isoform X2 n=1 Tax=Dromiciops gliroides TaxID=33562 RepID=UPI001CC6E7FC|nr:lymphotoxin-beta-like isoform X2 [Dromiciops gliroides]
MGAPGLEARAGGSNRKSRLLLASVGAAVLGTLLLSVPLTVMAVLALMPQEQGGQVADPSGPGGQLLHQLGFQKPLSVESRSDLSPIPPAAHLIGISKTGHGLHWVSGHEEAFLKSGTQFLGDEGLLALPQDGIYFLYCHIGYRGRAPSGGQQPGSHHQAGDPGIPLTLSSWLYRAGGAYGSGEPELLLQGAETVTPPVRQVRGGGQGTLWYASVGFGGLAQLREGEKIYVNVSHLDMVDFRRGKTFFGAVMVG